MSISVELASLHSAGLSRLVPAYLYEHYKDDFNERILVNLIGDLDHLIETVRASHSFQVLTLNERKRHKSMYPSNRLNSATAASFLPATFFNDSNEEEQSGNDDVDPDSMNGEKKSSDKSTGSLLDEISERLCDIFERYHHELSNKLNLFDEQAAIVTSKQGGNIGGIPDRAELLMYQRAILLKRLVSKHYELLVVFYRSVFDYFQKLSRQTNAEEDACEEKKKNETESEEQTSDPFGHYDANTLISKFHKLNWIL
jgi:hypothetical protein